jgi:hypothetical protein
MKHTKSTQAPFNERLAAQAQLLKEQAQGLPPGQAREAILRRVRQIDAAVKVNEWLSSPGLQPPA